MNDIPQNDKDLLEMFGIQDATLKKREDDKEKYAARAVNGSPNDAWVPVTNISLNRGIIPNMALTAWMEPIDQPGEYITVITLFRTNKGMLECFVPAHTKYYVGVGVV